MGWLNSIGRALRSIDDNLRFGDKASSAKINRCPDGKADRVTGKYYCFDELILSEGGRLITPDEWDRQASRAYSRRDRVYDVEEEARKASDPKTRSRDLWAPKAPPALGTGVDIGSVNLGLDGVRGSIPGVSVLGRGGSTAMVKGGMSKATWLKLLAIAVVVSVLYRIMMGGRK